jgi:hypothetical protein
LPLRLATSVRGSGFGFATLPDLISGRFWWPSLSLKLLCFPRLNVFAGFQKRFGFLPGRSRFRWLQFPSRSARDSLPLFECGLSRDTRFWGLLRAGSGPEFHGRRLNLFWFLLDFSRLRLHLG